TPYTIRDTRVSIEEKMQESSNAISAFDEILKEEKISSFEEERKKAKEEQAKIIEESRLGGLGDTTSVSSDTYEETTTSFSYSDPDPIVNSESEAELQALSFDAIKDYEFIPPPLSLFKSYDAYEDKEKLQEFIDYSIEHIKDVIKERKNHEIDITKIEHGPTFTRFEFKMPVTLPIKDIEGLSADLALHLASNAGVRIAQVPNTDRVGIEVANRERVQVGLKDVLSDKVFLDADPIKCPFVIGKDVTGKSLFLELADLTHILLAGTSGSGKWVFVTSLLLSLMCKVSPKDLRIVICDPKGVDFVSFSGAPHLLIDDIVVEPQKIDKVLAWAVQEMERRYDILKASRVAKIADYNKVMKGKDHMTRILIFVDEFADLVGDKSNSIMEKVQKLAQKARAAGIHLLLATQRPTVDIVSGSIKSNLSTRIALKVQNNIDSRTILDMGGAENLLVHGDMMFYSATNSQIQRAQGPNVSGEELYDVLSFIREKNPAIFDERLKAKIDSVPANSSSGGGASYGGDDDRDLDLKVKALKFVIDTKKTSISAMQREFRIGFNKAALVHDWLIKEGYITDLENGKAQINITLDQYKAKFGGV
ncbi:MAG: hypothetical protein J6C97_01685, partial [Clostridia bacterium]|nr:hypothetical protein [Clostridia bacterium]